MIGRCLICKDEFDTLDDYAEHELRHQIEEDRRRRARNGGNMTVRVSR